MYKLTKEERWEACVHEAAHAVIGALYGAFIDSVVKTFMIEVNSAIQSKQLAGGYEHQIAPPDSYELH